MSCVYHVREGPVDAVYIGRAIPQRGRRASKWGNPYEIGRDGTHEQVIEMYRAHLYESGVINDTGELAGEDVACWCAPEPCHGDVLLALGTKPQPLKEGTNGHDHAC